MPIKVMVQIECDGDECPGDTAVMVPADLSAKLTISDSYYEEKTVPDGIDIDLSPKLPQGWKQRTLGGYGFGSTTYYYWPKCKRPTY